MPVLWRGTIVDGGIIKHYCECNACHTKGKPCKTWEEAMEAWNMRVIDADKFKQQIAGMAIVNGYSAQKVNKMCELIDAQPTAYDVDKVVEQLEDLKSRVPVNRVLDDIINDKPKELGMLIAYDKAIEIVKAGEIDERQMFI